MRCWVSGFRAVGFCFHQVYGFRALGLGVWGFTLSRAGNLLQGTSGGPSLRELPYLVQSFTLEGVGRLGCLAWPTQSGTEIVYPRSMGSSPVSPETSV